MNTFIIALILLGLGASFNLGYRISEAKKPNQYDGLFIDHETLGKMRESWIEYGKSLGKEEALNGIKKMK